MNSHTTSSFWAREHRKSCWWKRGRGSARQWSPQQATQWRTCVEEAAHAYLVKILLYLEQDLLLVSFIILTKHYWKLMSNRILRNLHWPLKALWLPRSLKTPFYSYIALTVSLIVCFVTSQIPGVTKDKKGMERSLTIVPCRCLCKKAWKFVQERCKNSHLFY